MTKAGFRAMREQTGYSQQALADALHVNTRTVKRWEHEADASMPPADAWELLEKALDTQRRMAAYAVEVVREQEANLGIEPQAVKLTYYRDQAMFDRYGRDEGYFGVANANSRAAATALLTEGYEVEFSYPSENDSSSNRVSRSNPATCTRRRGCARTR